MSEQNLILMTSLLSILLNLIDADRTKGNEYQDKLTKEIRQIVADQRVTLEEVKHLAGLAVEYKEKVNPEFLRRMVLEVFAFMFTDITEDMRITEEEWEIVEELYNNFDFLKNEAKYQERYFILQKLYKDTQKNNEPAL